MATGFPRRLTSTAATITVALADGSSFINSPTTYKGNKTFNTLTSVRNQINATTGGWKQLPGTTLSSAFPSATVIDAISPVSVLRQPQWPHHWNVWGSAAWNGFGWWCVDPGGHFAGYLNGTYILRIADPVGPVRVHNPAPIEAVARRDTGLLVDRSEWASLAVSNVTSSPEWGPLGCHQYQGVVWDAEREILIVGGDAQNYITNPTAIGQTAVSSAAIYKFNPYAATPQSAWTRTPYTRIGNGGAFALVKGPSGNWHWRTVNDYGQGRRFSWNPDSGAPYVDTPPAPSSEIYSPWRTCAQDTATGKWYELKDRSGVIGLWDTTGTHSLVAAVPTEAFYPFSNDCWVTPIIVKSKAYLFAQASLIDTPTKEFTFGVTEIDLSSGTVRTYIDATVFSATSYNTGARSINGIFGRAAYVPLEGGGVFVAMVDATKDVWVFRPPASWGAF